MDSRVFKCDFIMTTARDVSIDILKGFAIFSVILLHSWDSSFLLRIGAPYHISQAVPIFIIISGFNGINSYVREKRTSLAQCYATIPRRMMRLLIPYSMILMFEYLYIIFINFFISKNASIIEAFSHKEQIYTFIHSVYSIPNVFSFVVTGGFGPGSFFIPILLPLIIV